MKRRVSDNEKGKIIVMLCDGSKIEWTKGRRNGNQKEDWMRKEKRTQRNYKMVHR